MGIMQNRNLLIVAAGIGLAGLGLYLFFYTPLMNQLRALGSECRSLEGEVNEARNLIAIFKAQETDKRLVPESEVSSILKELTRQGNFSGINFSSVTPRTIEEGSEYRILPIEMELESGYESLGKFLGLLDDLEGNLVKVRDFNITPKNDEPNNLTTRLTINLYLAERKHAG